MGCLKLERNTLLRIAHTSNSERSGEDKYCAGTYKYKFNGREYQDELGLNVTAMDFRQYDSAIGRFNSIDALSERAYDITPYRFALNNPNLWMDPTGLFETRKEAREYRREHHIKGGISRDSDGSFSINDKKNNVSYFKPEAGSNFVVDSEGVTQGALVSVEKKESNAVSTGKTINDYAGLALAPVEFVPGSFRLATSTRGFSPQFYGNSWGGNQFANTFNIGKLGKTLGVAGIGIGTVLDINGVYNYYDPKVGPKSQNSVNPGKAGLNLGMAGYGYFINPLPALLYTGIDTFYPGGWEGAANTAKRTEDQEMKMTGHPLFSNSAMKF